MKHYLLAVAVATAFSSCSPSGSEEIKINPDVFTNSRGMVLVNKDTFAYRDVEFAMKGKDFKTWYYYRIAKIDTAGRLGLRWPEFKDSQGRSIPKIIQPESLLIELKDSKGAVHKTGFPINP